MNKKLSLKLTDGDLYDETESVKMEFNVKNSGTPEVVDKLNSFLRATELLAHHETITVIENDDVIIPLEQYNDYNNLVDALQGEYLEEDCVDAREVITRLDKESSNVLTINKKLTRRVLSLDLVEEKLRKYDGNLLDGGLMWTILSELDEELA